MNEIEIGRGKRGRRAYTFDDVAVVPSRRTRDPEEVSVAWQIDAYRFELPVAAAPMDSVMSPTTAVQLGRLGGLDALVANAGVLHEASLSQTADETWDAVLETNLIGYYLYAIACLPHLREAGGGSITMISSDAGVWGETAIGVYSVSKRAVNMLVQTLAVEAGPAGIRVNAVCPGDTAPGMATYVSSPAVPYS